MNNFTILLPHFGALCVVAVVAYFFYCKLRMRIRKWLAAVIAIGLGCLASAAAFFVAVGLLPFVDAWMRAEPRGNATEATQAVIFGFSYVSESPNMLPGVANKELLAFVRTKLPNVTLILVQEGVWVDLPNAPQAPNGPNMQSIEDVVNGTPVKRVFRRFHLHDPGQYVNSLEASLCALQHLDRNKPTVIVAHDLQVARAVWNFMRICPKCDVVVPALPRISFVPNGKHCQTRYGFLWKPAELLWARPRDYFTAPPDSCPLPVPAAGPPARM